MRQFANRAVLVAIVSTALFIVSTGVGLAQPTDISAFHRSGQTFITWAEEAVAGERYNVYRHTQPVTRANIGEATLLTSRWGPLDDDSSAYWSELPEFDGPGLTPGYVINDFGPQLSADTGLFVWTTHEDGNFYYAVTTISGGAEDRANFSTENVTPQIAERVDEPQPVLARRLGAGDRVYLFTQYLDYSRYNPTFHNLDRAEHPNAQLYAANYTVSLPSRDDCVGDLALNLYLTGHGGRYHPGEDLVETPYNSCAVFIDADDPYQSWYFGHSSTYDYRDIDGDYGHVFASTGPIVNYTEERILKSLYDTIADPTFPVDTQRVYVYGHSMGGGGTLGLLLRYPNVFAAGYASEPMTNISASELWLPDAQWKWGSVAENLPIEIRAPNHWGDNLARYNGTGVWDWMNHQRQLTSRRNDEAAFISITHGTLDDVLDWDTQASPVYGLLYAGRRAFIGGIHVADHSWIDFSYGWPDPLGTGGLFTNWSFRCDESFPALSYATGNLGTPPPRTMAPADAVVGTYNTSIEWSSSWYGWDRVPVDTAGEWQVSLRSTSGVQTVDVTPRRTRRFQSGADARYRWTNTSIGTGAVVASGEVAADGDGIITVPGVSVSEGGNRVRITAVDPPADGDAPAEGCSSVTPRKRVGPPPGPPGGSPPNTDRPDQADPVPPPSIKDNKPVISKLSYSLKKEKKRKKGRKRKRGKQIYDLWFKFNLSVPSTVRITVGRKSKGVKVRGKCRRAGKKARSRKRCIYYRKVGSLKINGRAGLNKAKLRGKLSARNLKRGNYQTTLVAIDTTGNRSDPVSFRFNLK